MDGVELQLLPRATAVDPLTTLLDRALDMPDAAAAARPFLPQLARRERGARAVILYGSYLWPTVRAPSSHPDFIVLASSLRAWHGRLAPLLLGGVLAPTVYRLRGDDAEAKLTLVTVRQLRTHAGARAPDLHLIGRLSKRVALVWCSDPSARRLVVEAQACALRALVPLALARVGDGATLDDFMRALFRLSYDSEIRIVEPRKVDLLFAAEAAHYRGVGRALLAELGVAADDPTAPLRLPPGAAASPRQLRARLRRSRRRALYRLPKYLLTYDGWLEYLLRKLARAGSPVSLTRRQRRHPLLFALPVLYRLAKAHRVG